MKVFLILLVLFSVFLVLLFLSACKVAGLADEQIERDFQRWIAAHPEAKEKFREGVDS